MRRSRNSLGSTTTHDKSTTYGTQHHMEMGRIGAALAHFCATAGILCDSTAGVFEPIDVTALRLGIRRSMLRPELNAKGNCGNWLV